MSIWISRRDLNAYKNSSVERRGNENDISSLSSEQVLRPKMYQVKLKGTSEESTGPCFPYTPYCIHIPGEAQRSPTSTSHAKMLRMHLYRLSECTHTCFRGPIT